MTEKKMNIPMMNNLIMKETPEEKLGNKESRTPTRSKEYYLQYVLTYPNGDKLSSYSLEKLISTHNSVSKGPKISKETFQAYARKCALFHGLKCEKIRRSKESLTTLKQHSHDTGHGYYCIKDETTNKLRYRSSIAACREFLKNVGIPVSERRVSNNLKEHTHLHGGIFSVTKINEEEEGVKV